MSNGSTFHVQFNGDRTTVIGDAVGVAGVPADQKAWEHARANPASSEHREDAKKAKAGPPDR